MITLVHWQELTAPERHVAQAIEFMGGQIALVNLSQHEERIAAGAFVVAHVSALVERATRDGGADGVRNLLSGATKCFIYGFEPTPAHGDLLRQLTSGRLTGVEESPGGDAQFSVERDAADVCLQFAGLTFSGAEHGRDFVFAEGEAPEGCRCLIRTGGRPFLVSARNGSCDMLLLACRGIADIEEVIPRHLSLVHWFSRLAPLVMFLRLAEGEQCWHVDEPRACLIIDDPLLKKQYGFLDYHRLITSLKQERSCACIAFIPWNYRRSSKSVLRLFAENPQRMSLCVHGCDHTRGEFGGGDLRRLRDLAEEALRRMRRHRTSGDVEFDDVMVFPQGRFSPAAMSALQACGYLAAVNTTPFPVSFDGDSLRLRDVMAPAVTKFSGFPLFTRHYPDDVSGLAFALLLGKPALLVEHHGYFRAGYEPLSAVVRQLNQMDRRLDWCRLAVICSRACLKRRMPNGEVHVRFYTDRFSLRNHTGERQRYVLLQRQAGEGRWPDAFVNDKLVSPDRATDDLCLAVDLDPDKAVDVEIRRVAPEWPSAAGPPRLTRQARVFVRRRLSEFGANYVDKSPVMSRLASRVRAHLRGNA